MAQLSEQFPQTNNSTNPGNIIQSSTRVESNRSNSNSIIDDSIITMNGIGSYDVFVKSTSLSRSPRFPTLHGAPTTGKVKRKRLDRDILFECIDSDPLDFSIVSTTLSKKKITEVVNGTISFESKINSNDFKDYYLSPIQQQRSSSSDSEISARVDESLGSLKTTRVNNTKASNSSSFSSGSQEFEYRDDDNDSDNAIHDVNRNDTTPFCNNDGVEEFDEGKDLYESEHDNTSEREISPLHTRYIYGHIHTGKLLEKRKGLAYTNQIKPSISSSSSSSSTSSSFCYQSSEQEELRTSYANERRRKVWSPFPCQEIPEDSFDEEYRKIEGHQMKSNDFFAPWALFTCLSFQNNSSSDKEDDKEGQEGLMQKIFHEIREIAKDPFMTTPIHDDFISLKETSTATFSIHDDESKSISTSSRASFSESNECARLMETTVTPTFSTIPERMNSFCAKDTEKAPSDTQIEVSNHGSLEFLQVNEKIISILTSPSNNGELLSPCCSSDDSMTVLDKSEKRDYSPLHHATKYFKRKEQIKNTWAKFGKNVRCVWIKSALFFGKNPYLPQQRGWSEEYMEDMFGKFSLSENVTFIKKSKCDEVDDTRQDIQCD
jgi:hypothetical protein